MSEEKKKLKDFVPAYLKHYQDGKTIDDLLEFLKIEKKDFYTLKARATKKLKEADPSAELPKLSTGDLEGKDILALIQAHKPK